MKKILAFIFLFVFTLQSFANSLVIFNFKIHQAKIAKTTCVNRFRPQMHCNGKCQLMKQLKALEQKQSGTNEEPKSNGIKLLENYFTSLLQFAESNSIYINKNKTNSYIYDGYSHHYFSEIFHPPAFIC